MQPLFISLVKLVCSSKDDFIHNIGKSSNANFPLRAYLTFMKNNNHDEISVTVDVVSRDGIYFIETDICGSDGEILADGPAIQMIDLIKKDLSSWLKKYEDIFNI